MISEKKVQWTLVLSSVSLTLGLALGAFWIFAPELLGIAPRMDLERRLPMDQAPFFDTVFQAEVFQNPDFIVQGRYLSRARPLFPNRVIRGPNDLLGFRNHAIPNAADVITIGDSQTTGENVVLEENWPSLMMRRLGRERLVLYNMSVGGWGPVEELEILQKAAWLSPLVVIAAFYTGNDALDAFSLAYADPRWESLRPDPELKPSDAPSVAYPQTEDQFWRADFGEEGQIVFTPKYRRESNRKIPVVDAGYGVMANAARQMGQIAGRRGFKLIFTIVPTKELAFAKKVEQAGLTPSADYSALVEEEQERLSALAGVLAGVPGAQYVDVVQPLQEAALDGAFIYPQGANGHPLRPGYEIIAQTLAPAAAGLLPPEPDGPIIIKDVRNEYFLALLRDGKIHLFKDMDVFHANGWKVFPQAECPPRFLMNTPYGEPITMVDQARFGPR